MTAEILGSHRTTLGADQNYDMRDCVRSARCGSLSYSGCGKAGEGMPLSGQLKAYNFHLCGESFREILWIPQPSVQRAIILSGPIEFFPSLLPVDC